MSTTSPNTAKTMTSTGGSGKTAVVLGATGAVGKHVLSQLLSTPPSSSTPAGYSTIYSLARRANPSPPPVSPGLEYKEIIVDFEKLDSEDPTELEKVKSAIGGGKPDTVFITMGTTRAQAGSAEAFEKIDREYVVAASRALCAPSTPDPNSNSKKVTRGVYCSSTGASSSSPFLYLKSKGLTEQSLSSVFDETVILRPAYLAGAERPTTRITERVAQPFLHTFSTIFSAIGLKPLEAKVEDVAKAMIKSAADFGNVKDLVHKGYAVHPNPKHFKIGKEDKVKTTVILENHTLIKLAHETNPVS